MSDRAPAQRALWLPTDRDQHVPAEAQRPSLFDNRETAVLEQPLTGTAPMEPAHDGKEEQHRPDVREDEEPTGPKNPRNLPNATELVGPVVEGDGAKRHVDRGGLQRQGGSVADLEAKADVARVFLARFGDHLRRDIDSDEVRIGPPFRRALQQPACPAAEIEHLARVGTCVAGAIQSSNVRR